MQVFGEGIEHYDLLNSLACAQFGIAFVQIANGDVNRLKKEMQRIIKKLSKRCK